MIQFNSRWIKSSPVFAVFSPNFLFRSITSRKMASATASVDFNYAALVFGDFQCVKHIYYASVFWQPGIKHSYSILTQMRTLSPCIFPFWKWRRNTFLVDLNSTNAILSPRLTSGDGEILLACEQMPASTVYHMTETAHHIICFLSAEIPLIIQLRDFYLFWICKHLDLRRDRSWKHPVSHIFGK